MDLHRTLDLNSIAMDTPQSRIIWNERYIVNKFVGGCNEIQLGN